MAGPGVLNKSPLKWWRESVSEPITRTFPQAEWARREAEWHAEGLTMVSVASYRSEGRRMARVTLMKEDEG